MTKTPGLLVLKPNRRGPSALEYGLIAGIVVASMVFAFSAVASALANQFAALSGGL